eukprot:5532501-Pyramimonas_sp.AAC.1
MAPWPERHTVSVVPHECADSTRCKYHGDIAPVTPEMQLQVPPRPLCLGVLSAPLPLSAQDA